MANGRRRTPGTVADLRWMRRVTAVTLWLLVLIGAFLQFVIGLDTAPGPWAQALVIATSACVALAFAAVPLLLRGESGVSPSHPVVVLMLVVSGATWVFSLLPPFNGWGWGFMFAISGGMLSCLVPRWWSAAALAATIGIILLGFWSESGTPPAAVSRLLTANSGMDLVVAWTLIAMSFMPLSTVWVLRLVLRLDEARRTASELAVATERLRFATDLHDIQGHHLQVIALKGELAERQLRSGHTKQAAEELSEIRAIAQTALEDTRAVVNDYRTVTVAVEARNAASVLRSAGIQCTTQIDAASLPAATASVFALAIREAATNILRHSKATAASLELLPSGQEEYRLTVTNNGAGPLRPAGTGLNGIAERSTSVGGSVTHERHNDIFTLVVRIPVQPATPTS